MKTNTSARTHLHEVKAELEREYKRFGEHDPRRDSYSRALGRLIEGRYGICESCGNDISVDRLLAIPETPYCIACGSRSAPAGRLRAVTTSSNGESHV